MSRHAEEYRRWRERLKDKRALALSIRSTEDVCGLCGHPNNLFDRHEGWVHVGSPSLTPHQAAANARDRLEAVTGDFGGRPDSPLGYIWYPREGTMGGISADLIVFDEHRVLDD